MVAPLLKPNPRRRHLGAISPGSRGDGIALVANDRRADRKRLPRADAAALDLSETPATH